MRKLYALLAMLFISLASIQVNAKLPTEDLANFTYTVDVSNNNIIFTNTSVIGDIAGTRHSFWSFGDGSGQWTGVLDGTQHHYQLAGTYTVCLKIYRYGSNIDSVLSAEVCKTIVIESVCRANFEFRDSLTHIDPLKHLVYLWAIPFNSANKPATQVCWNFGDGTDTCINMSTTVPPTNLLAVQHTYYQQGSFNVCIRIKYLDGCVAEKCKLVILQNPSPDSCKADFERLPVTSTNNPLLAYFRALPWDNNNKKPAGICWTFGDGRDTCIQYQSTYTGEYAVAHQYQQRGAYEVCVKILYYGGCEAGKCKSIQIGEPDSCRADFETISVASNSLRKYFIANPWHNHNKKPVYICWKFGDNHDTCIQYTNTYTGSYAVGHTYNHAGLYEVCVRIVYDGGCESNKCKLVQVGERDSCSAGFETISVTSNPLRKYFTANPWHNHNKKPVYICWKFGDNHDTCIQYATTYTGSYAVGHTYNHAGLYEVCVRIVYDGGCESNKCKLVQVGERDSCSAGFETISVTSNPLRKYFIANPWHNLNKKPVYICWKFGDNHDTCIHYTTTYTGSYAVGHTYNHAGLYEVCVRIVYDGGCESNKCKLVQVGERDSCSADFETISVTSNPLRTYFIANPWHNLNKKPVYICWKFGDNHDTCIRYTTTYTGSYAVGHTYNNSGQYEVCVRIVYDGGCESKKCKIVLIGEPDSCRADFEKIPTTANTALTDYFRALPWNNNNKKPARICWTFGDGRDTCIKYESTYTGQYVVAHHYQHGGVYEVCVSILYFGGCEAKKCKLIVIPPLRDNCAVRLFEITPSVTSLVRGFFVSTSSTIERRPVRICWYFGDGTDTCVQADTPNSISLPEFFIRHTYPAPGVYKACVKVLFHSGCIAYDCIEVVIRSATDICGGYMIDSLTGPQTFKFKGFSIHNPNDQAVGYRWTFGDGSSTAGQEVNHTYIIGGNYEVCLYIKTELGCETRICKTLHVPGNNQPTLQLYPNPVINVLHVHFFSTQNELINIKIVNASGITVRNYTRNVVVGSNNWDLDLSNLLPGIYSFVIQSVNQLASAVFLKQ